MLDISALQASFPTLSTLHSSSLAKAKRASAPPKHPRSYVIALLDNSIKMLADPQYTVKQKRTGNMKAPETCYKINQDGSAHISLRYAKKKLAIDNGKDTITVLAADLPQVLEQIKGQVANGVLDTVICKTHDDRSSTMKQKLATKKAAGQASKKAA